MDLRRWVHFVISVLILTASQPARLPLALAETRRLQPAGSAPFNDPVPTVEIKTDTGLSLNKTVGTNPNACAATDAIIVPAGTRVTYCYNVTNTGNENLVTHTLVDDRLGSILTSFPYVLSPGASAFITQTTTVNIATLNTATWTGTTAGNDPVDATDTAKVAIAAPGGIASLSIEKTVGTDASACAATDSINVPAGTKVTYCYTVTNTGSQALTTHDLVDDQLGTILAAFPYNLAPGASAFLTQTLTVNSSVTNLATWTGHTAGGAVASELDTATVTVGPEQPSLSLDKTVGTDASACAATDSIDVPAGTKVTYCYTVTNTGPQALTTHDLVDDQLGSILAAFPYNLAPSASAFLTQTLTVNSSVTNLATWTGHTAGGATAADTDSAVVTITSGQSYYLYLPEILK